MQHLSRNGPKQSPPEETVTVGRQRDQVRFHFVGEVDDDLRRVAVQDPASGFHAWELLAGEFLELRFHGARDGRQIESLRIDYA